MLDLLPPEILHLIAAQLPRAKDLASLAKTCRRLHEVVGPEDWHKFVATKFPGVETPPLGVEAAQALTSRARAVDKHAVVGRFLYPRPDALRLGGERALRRDNPTHGYRPALDSYEVWHGPSWNDRREVLAWGAADELFLRVTQSGANTREKWVAFNDLDHSSSLDDICGVHLLRPEHPAKESQKEHVIFARMRGELVHISIDPEDASLQYRQRFFTAGDIECTDLGPGKDPVLSAHQSDGSVFLFPTTSDEDKVWPFARLKLDNDNLSRNRYSKFLSPSLFAVGTGGIDDAIAISVLSQERVSLSRELSAEDVDFERWSFDVPIKSHVNAIAPLEATGNVFLASWGDRAVRLHDLRSNSDFEQAYRDTTDPNPIYCVQPFGHNGFVVGSGGNALVKFFDLRMTKTETYSYRDPHPGPSPATGNPNSITTGLADLSLASVHGLSHPRKGFNIFLSHPPPSSFIRATRARRIARPYRGAIYTMSSPSPSSPTIYTGIADGVVRLDFVSTDDLYGPCKEWYRNPLMLDPGNVSDWNQPDRVLEVAGYDRPETLSASLALRSQVPFVTINEENIDDEQRTGWDRRWEKIPESGAWRRR
ncbi:F-box domain protein [Aspergillus heteromorphus CBS 117.55]|uniref:F-box domain protein n=1 Tax=Aspergillus heteromorphus CBS 117.55 TaxID=1448321 RepID=A0A317WCH5_9EURO|nr:F-box domain protein [Aspergillus heteromorphus CBS 117.55]PWY82902.1 F-box domain protein [Aspergillus heteromorphus CBS 117.55]